MQRYFVEFDSSETLVHLRGEEVHHIKNVMRMKIGDAVYLSNQQVVYYAVIQAIHQDEVVCELQYEVKKNVELPIKVAIAQGLPKSDKFELVIQKTTELGVQELIPVTSERSIIKLDAKKEGKKLERYQKIAKEASEQSHRMMIPTIQPVMSVSELIKYSQSFTYKCLAYEATTERDEHNLFTILNEVKEGDSLLVFIGPEGGISEKELERLVDNGFTIVSLGRRILRTETAPIFLMSAVVYQLEVKG
jgi:16S rRNA (uracil1498-N3)-methyltransferase